MDRQLTFEILLYLNMYYTMFYAGIQTIFFFMKYLYVPDFGKNIIKIAQCSRQVANLGHWLLGMF